MRASPVARSCLFAVALCACAAPSSGQGVGAIGGTIADASGAVLPGATVILRIERSTTASK